MSTDILLSSNVIVFLFMESILLFLQFIAFFFVLKILKSWDFKSTSSLQYSLEKQSYLVTLLIYFTIIIKLFLLPYFAYTVDTLSNIVPGAMCGAGVISSNDYGEPLLILKTFILFFSSLWLIVNKADIAQKNFPYLKKKLYYFLFIFILFIIEYYLDIQYLINISTESIVTCCSAIYSSVSKNPLPFHLNLQALLIVFYGLFITIILANKKQYYIFTAILNILFLYISYYSILYFFGTYIYELPTHHCPFCMLQQDYYYIGYSIFLSLFLGTFYGMVNAGLKLLTKNIISKYYLLSSIWNTIFVSICTLYVLVYYLKNGVFL